MLIVRNKDQLDLYIFLNGKVRFCLYACTLITVCDLSIFMNHCKFWQVGKQETENAVLERILLVTFKEIGPTSAVQTLLAFMKI